MGHVRHISMYEFFVSHIQASHISMPIRSVYHIIMCLAHSSISHIHAYSFGFSHIHAYSFSVSHLQVPRTYPCLFVRCLTYPCLFVRCLTPLRASHIQASHIVMPIRSVYHIIMCLTYPSVYSFGVMCPSSSHNHAYSFKCLAYPSA